MSRTTEVCFDISSGVLVAGGITIRKGTMVSEECIGADQPITMGNIHYITVEDNAGVGYNDVFVQSSTVPSFVVTADYNGGGGYSISGELVVFDLYNEGINKGTVYFDITGLAGVNSPDDVTFRIISNNYSRIFPTVLNPATGDRFLLETLNAVLDKEYIVSNHIRLAQSFSNLKRSYRTIQNEKTFKTNDDYLRKLKTFKTRKYPCQ